MKTGMTVTSPIVSEEISASESPVPIGPGGIFSIFNRSLHPTANFPCDESVHFFIRKNYPKTSVRDWNSWNWQIKNSIHTAERLKEIFGESYENVISSLPENHLPFRITPYFASLLSRFAPDHPLFRTMIPAKEELTIGNGEKNDPLDEANDTPVPHIVHRYPDRVLFTVTGFCAAYCRYCTRSHMVAKKNKSHVSTKSWDRAIEYIAANEQIRDVLISGGDPLTLSDARLEYLLSRLRAIPHVEIIRIGTKIPVVLPMRITKSLIKIIKKYHPVMMSLHFSHPDELSIETKEACNRLADGGIPLGSQCVLLKGVNDQVETFMRLNHELLKVRVRPYYIYQCDPIPGSAHFRTEVKKGIEIIKGLHGFTSGYAVPHFVIDAPGGGGKIPLLPESIKSVDKDGITLVNYLGKEYIYPEKG
ncbi:MAG: KamA family radical SAM protein [Bacteroidia bacterium]|nr:KamA family radical SAM protein [Bacteroidia bacterium]